MDGWMDCERRRCLLLLLERLRIERGVRFYDVS